MSRWLEWNKVELKSKSKKISQIGTRQFKLQELLFAKIVEDKSILQKCTGTIEWETKDKLASLSLSLEKFQNQRKAESIKAILVSLSLSLILRRMKSQIRESRRIVVMKNARLISRNKVHQMRESLSKTIYQNQLVKLLKSQM